MLIPLSDDGHRAVAVTAIPEAVGEVGATIVWVGDKNEYTSPCPSASM